MDRDRTHLLRLLEGTLDDASARRLHRHMDHDPDLQAEWNRLQALQTTLQTHTASFDEGFARRVMHRLSSATASGEALFTSLRWLFVRMELAAATLIILLAAYNIAGMSDALAASSFIEALFGLPGTTLENILIFGAM